MGAVAEPHSEHEQLGLELLDCGDGWWFARIGDTAAMSQGRTREEARYLAVAAYYDLVHRRPSTAERVLNTVRAWRADLRDRLRTR
jgi:hypothetical protein